MAGSTEALGGGMGKRTPKYCRSMARVGSSRFIFNPTEQTHQEVSMTGGWKTSKEITH